ncbi:MAG TPA: PIN domain-containing protein [Verrucomicrobiae bacterium]|jgi:predicted nucleic acid-binding protein|nr:PIN domain-containing protein [Verrucomicrobiae bacterium]
MRIALDTNLLAYAEGVNGAQRKQVSLGVVQKLSTEDIVVPVQALGELFHVLVRKAGRTPVRARTAVLSWYDAFAVAETSVAVVLGATDLAAAHRLSIWDSVIVSAAAEAGCRLLITEDLQDGFTWQGVTVANPFAKVLHPLLDSLLN